MVFNKNGAIFFQGSLQHSALRADGISYKDNYKGNAMAAMLRRGSIEIRYHKKFSVPEVRGIVSTLMAEPGLEFMTGWKTSYQGRALTLDQ